MSSSPTILVFGGLNTDVIGLQVERLVGPGELSMGGTLQIGPGGKSCNIARMIAALTPPETVGFIGRTARDPYGLWRLPVDALRSVGVNTEHLAVQSFEETGLMPGIALIPVDRSGQNQIYVLPGANAAFSPEDIDAVRPLIAQAKFIALAMELPFPTAERLLNIARACDVPVLLDPGGLGEEQNIDALLEGLYLLKPNEHEAQMLTGIQVRDATSAEHAAHALTQRGVRTVMITAGASGAYLLHQGKMHHIPPAAAAVPGDVRDATGCGDQVHAALCAFLARDWDMETAARAAIIAGTLQYGRAGIVPVTQREIEPMLQ